MIASDPFRVMVVDDSAVIRGLIARALNGDPDITVTCTAANGEQAIKTLAREDVEIVVLDIEMPVMDGLTALPRLLETRPGVQVIMASTLTTRNADISLKALQLGAIDYLAKPESTSQIHSADDFRNQLCAKIKAVAGKRRRLAGRAPRAAREADRSAPTAGTAGVSALRAGSVGAPNASASAGFTLRRPESFQLPQAIAIGSSTGGPQALFKVFQHLGDLRGQPVFVTQHMPPTFTALLGKHLSQSCGLACGEAEEGESVVGGRVYIAPGDCHMLVRAKSGGLEIKLSDAPPENFCRPAVDPMLRSLVSVYGARLLAVILTGMGSDGKKGAEAVVQAGGNVIAQDEASSVVWGMPGAVAMAGLCSAVLPVDDIGPHLRKLLMRTAA